MSNDSITVCLPASTSNCGPGFDTLALALKLHNHVRIVLRKDGEIRPSEAEGALDGTQPMVAEMAGAFYKAVGEPARGLEYEIWGTVPIARGLGSSAILRAGILAGLNRLHGDPLDQNAMIRIVSLLDNAPDNATAVFRGGFVVARSDPGNGHYIDSLRFDVDDTLRFVVVSPDIMVHTKDARKVLPQEFAFSDAVRSLNSSSYLVGVFATREYHRLSHAVADYMNQPYRQRLCPFVPESIAAGVAAGAYTGWLSGSGSSVLCVAPTELALQVGKAMSDVFTQSGVPNRHFQLAADNSGLRYE